MKLIPIILTNKKNNKIIFDGYLNENGKEEGLIKTFYNNGCLKSITKWKNGVKVGIHEYYSVFGELVKKKIYSFENLSARI